MRSLHWGQRLMIAVALSLMLLMVGMVGLGLAIRNGVVELPEVNLRYAPIGIAAYRTRYPDCPPYIQCPPQSVAPPQAYFVVWVLTQTRQPAPLDERKTGIRLIALPLRNQDVESKTGITFCCYHHIAHRRRKQERMT